MGRLTDGHPTKITFALSATVKLYEKEVTPPGLEGGGANDTTTMHNVLWRTRSPKVLITMSEQSFSAAYDPACYSELLTMLNENQLITVTFPDDSTVKFWGWLDSFKPGRVVEGAQPLADCVIMPSNQNSSGVETGPVYAA